MDPERLINVLTEPYRDELRLLNEQLENAEDALLKARTNRDSLINFLRDEKGMSFVVIADLAGLTRQRVHQIVQP